MNRKQTVPALVALLCSSLPGLAQCDTNVSLTASKTEYLDATMAVQRTVDEKSVVEISDSVLTIAPGNEPHKMTGKILSQTCNWTVPYKEGKSVIRARLEEESGEIENVTFTIEGKEGNVTLLAEVDNMPDRKIRVAADTFAAKK